MTATIPQKPLIMGESVQHVYHHTEGPKVNIKAEKNTKGWNYEATVTGAESVGQAMGMLGTAIQALHEKFDPPDPEPEPAPAPTPATPEDESKAEVKLTEIVYQPIVGADGLHTKECCCPDCVPF